MSEVDRARRARERGDGRTWRERALAAEAEVARLRDGLREIAGKTPTSHRREIDQLRDAVKWRQGIARDLLADQDGAADRDDLVSEGLNRDRAECDHGITLQNEQTGRERCAKCGFVIEGGVA